MKEWAQQLSQIRSQISELRTTLSKNETSATAQKEAMEDAAKTIRAVLQTKGTEEGMAALLKVLHSSVTQQLIGAMLISADGTVLMQHSSGQRLLAVDPSSNKLPSGCYYDGTTGDVIADSESPWQRCQRGEAVESTTHLIVRQGGMSEDMHVELSVVGLRMLGNVSGVIILFRDMTENIQTGGYIKRLCSSLEKQMTVAEEALRELNVLSERLGMDTISQEMKVVRPTASTQPAARKRVLIVDDIPVNHTLLTLQLTKMGVDADLANNGMEAVLACKRQQYTMIFMDVGMPVLNGFQATAEIRKLEAATGAHTPIVAMTAHDSEADQKQCLREGMDDYLTKGGSKTRLREIVNRYVYGVDPTPPAVAPTAPNLTSDAARLDLDWLQDTFGDDVTRVATVFIGAATTLLNCLELAIGNKDLGAVNHFSFSLKGPCSSIGLLSMSKIAFELSEDAAHDRWDAANEKYNQLREALASVKEQIVALGDGQYSAASS